MFVALVAAPELETLAFVGVPNVTTLVLSSFHPPRGSEGQLLFYTPDYVSPSTLPENVADHYIAIASIGSDGIPIMNFDDFQLHASRIGDGLVDFLDIGPFVDVLNEGVYQFEADINQDGDVNFLDIASFVDLLSGK